MGVWRDKIDNNSGWLVLLYAGICEGILLYRHSGEIEDEPLELLLMAIYTLPICAFLLMALSIIPYCVINALGVLDDKPTAKSIAVLTMAAAGLLVMYR